MATINLTNNTGLNLTAASADNNATLNRYLKSLLTLRPQFAFDPLDKLSDLAFPVTLMSPAKAHSR